jgi:rhodanese-related sulfurtransferase
VREPHEFAEGYIAGGKLVPLGKIQTMQVEELEDLKEEEVMVYCRSGRRSMMACMVLDQLGFKDTYQCGRRHPGMAGKVWSFEIV